METIHKIFLSGRKEVGLELKVILVSAMVLTLSRLWSLVSLPYTSRSAYGAGQSLNLLVLYMLLRTLTSMKTGFSSLMILPQVRVMVSAARVMGDNSQAWGLGHPSARFAFHPLWSSYDITPHQFGHRCRISLCVRTKASIRPLGVNSASGPQVTLSSPVLVLHSSHLSP
jgi:hypothetical protein